MSHGRWAWASSPRGSHADQPGEASVLPSQEQDGSRHTPEDALPSRPSGSQRRRTTTLQSDLPPGPYHQPSENPGSTRVSVPESSSVLRRGSPRGLTPVLERRRTRSAVWPDYTLCRNGPGA